MSPEAAATDQVYSRLKSDIVGGRYAPIEVLNVHAVAAEIGMSISPIRDAMERLVGERLLAVRTGGGFQMPPMTVEIARDLYNWHAFLVRGAVRSGVVSDRFKALARFANDIDATNGASLVAITTEYFDLIGELTGNPEHRIAIRAAGERLHALRLQETRIKDRKAELLRLATLSMSGASSSAIRDAIAAYHKRRLNRLPALTMALYHP
jgi:DNA-binding GntR family transcriptional regulator